MTQPLLFINPPRRHDGTRALFNNATLTLASYLVKNGQPARTYSANGPDWKWKVSRWLEEHRPRAVAISCKWWDTLYGATELARFVKELNPSVQCIAGGQTATSFCRELVQKTAFDAVIKGDGEQPLLEYLRGEPRSNLCTAQGLDLPTTYVQTGGAEDLRLLSDLTEIADPLQLANIGHSAPYVWTGKGCRCACLFCGGSALGQKKLFGRKGYLYRPIEHVLHDMEVMASWSDNTIMFDFDPIADPEKEGYYRELFERLPAKKYHLFFYAWSLPSLDFIELLEDRFASVFCSLDAQCYSERLRYELASKNQLKPFRPNRDFEAAIARIGDSPNMEAGLYGIIGLAGERPEDVAEAFRWTQHLVEQYGVHLSDLSVTPLSTEPGALLDRNPQKYGMVVERHGFEQYLEFTRHQFFSERGIHESDYDPLLPHPYGVYAEGEYPGRVHRDFNALLAHIQEGLSGVHQTRSARSLRYFTDRLQLRLESKSRYYNPWTLISWGIRIALDKGYRRLEVDATQAHILCPSRAVLVEAELDPGTAARLGGLARTLEHGFELTIRSSTDSVWGFWEELGARVLRDPQPLGPSPQKGPAVMRSESQRYA